jgi:hypothetical protein
MGYSYIHCIISSVVKHMNIGKTLAVIAAVAIGLVAVVPSLTGTVHAALASN